MNTLNDKEKLLLELYSMLSAKSKAQLIETAKALVKAEQKLQKTRN